MLADDGQAAARGDSPPKNSVTSTSPTTDTTGWSWRIRDPREGPGVLSNARVKSEACKDKTDGEWDGWRRTYRTTKDLRWNRNDASASTHSR